VGGFASQFDLIASEYGWTDQQIGELPFMRFQQIVSAIELRRATERRTENARFSWLARNLSQFVAGGYLTDGKQENTAIADARRIAFDKVEAAMLAHYEEQAALKPAPIEAKRGSFESLMGFMGQQR
jgi:hypothetical protein